MPSEGIVRRSLDEMPPRMRQLFDEVPTAHMGLVEFGHAYGKAKYPGVCKVSGLPIIIGRSIRTAEFWTRDGRYFSGYVPSETAELLHFYGSPSVMDPEVGFARELPAHSVWHLWDGSSWLDELKLSERPKGTRFQVCRVNPGAYAPFYNSWTLDEVGGKRVWYQNYAKSTDAQLMAACRRVKKAVTWAIEEPRRSLWES